MTVAAQPPLRIFVTVGTDHHPFHRLTTWLDEWLDAQPEEHPVECLVQTGTSASPQRARSVAYLEYAEMEEAFETVDAVVCHGGPATIMGARAAGRVPIVVPRRHHLGEHVDDHQLHFARRLGSSGSVVLAETAPALHEALDRVAACREAFAISAGAEETDASVERFEQLVDEMLGKRSSNGASRLPSPTGGDVRVLYIGGWGRSGSTLLSRMAAQVPGAVFVGELRDIWQRGPVENRLCGCGASFSTCEFWQVVGDRAFGGWDQHDARELARLRLRLDRPWHAPLLLQPRLSPAYRRRLSTYTELLARLYRAIADVAGASVVIDSSKIPTYALLLRHVEGLDLRVVHLVRDSRGVLFSWQKHVARPDSTGSPDDMTRYRAASGAARYVLYNGLTGALSCLGVPRLLVRYEDMVRAPGAAVASVLSHAGLPHSLSDLEPRGGRMTLRSDHTIDGNPNRFSNGKVSLRLDEAWREGMDWRTKAVVTSLTYPLLQRYGYSRPKPQNADKAGP